MHQALPGFEKMQVEGLTSKALQCHRVQLTSPRTESQINFGILVISHRTMRAEFVTEASNAHEDGGHRQAGDLRKKEEASMG
jgi:hypothetical protein